MEKRSIIAVILTFCILSLYSLVLSKFYPIENKKDTSNLAIKPEVISKETISFPSTKQDVSQGVSRETISNERAELVLSLPEATINQIFFKEYNYTLALGNSLLLRDEPGISFTTERIDKEITFLYRDGNREITKKINFSNINYTIEIELIIRNLSDSIWKDSHEILLATISPNAKTLEERFLEAEIFSPLGIIRTGLSRPKKEMGEVVGAKAAGFRDRYFCAILLPLTTANSKGFIRKIANNEVEIGLSLNEKEILPRQERRERFLLYLGPQDTKALLAFGKEYKEIISFGTFDSISKVLLGFLGFLQHLTGNWGIAVVLLSIFTFIALYPLTLKQMTSLKQMQVLQPQIEQLRASHKDNPKKLNKEVLELYRLHKINPLGGCLPMVLQIPIFFSLYQGLMRSIYLKGAKFLWIKDLSLPDRLFSLPSSLPVIGNEFNILPILMAGMMLFQQRLSMKNSTAASLEQQKIMAVLMPVLFGFVFYHMPSGLVLYWFINSLLTLLYQWKVSR